MRSEKRRDIRGRKTRHVQKETYLYKQSYTGDETRDVSGLSGSRIADDPLSTSHLSHGSKDNTKKKKQPISPSRYINVNSFHVCVYVQFLVVCCRIQCKCKFNMKRNDVLLRREGEG